MAKRDVAKCLELNDNIQMNLNHSLQYYHVLIEYKVLLLPYIADET